MLERICSLLYEKGKIKRNFLKPEFNFSFQGITLSLKRDVPISSSFALLIKMLDILKKKKKKVLFVIDEIDNSRELKYFISVYHQLIKSKYPFYLLMTGFYENVSKVKNDLSIGFLYRGEKIYLNPLPLNEIGFNYAKHLNITKEEALHLTKFTKGYAYAYQILGNILYKRNKKEIDNDVVFEFDRILAENAYDKIYSELSYKEKLIVKSFDTNEKIETKEILTKTQIDIKKFSVYRDCLIKKVSYTRKTMDK